MKIEIEVSEDLLRQHLDEYIKSNLQSRYLSYSLKNLLEDQVKKALVSAFKESDFSIIIEEECRQVAISEIRKAAAKKTPGWVNQQMKEMLKYARARFWEDAK